MEKLESIAEESNIPCTKDKSVYQSPSEDYEGLKLVDYSSMGGGGGGTSIKWWM